MMILNKTRNESSAPHLEEQELSEAEASEVDPRCENIYFSEVFNRT